MAASSLCVVQKRGGNLAQASLQSVNGLSSALPLAKQLSDQLKLCPNDGTPISQQAFY